MAKAVLAMSQILYCLINNASDESTTSPKFAFQLLSITQQSHHLNGLSPSHTYKVGAFLGLLRGTV